MSKSKKLSKKEMIEYYLGKAKIHNNAGRYKKAVQNINLAYYVWQTYKNPTSKKADKMFNMIWDARDIVEHNYLTRKSIQLQLLFFTDSDYTN